MKILVINGPNINMLGIREKEIYGSRTYAELLDFIKKCAAKIRVDIECFQSNHEGAIVDKIQSAYGAFDAVVINPAAYTHTSIAIADALKAVNIPYAEVHLTDIDEREDFRKKSYISADAAVVIKGKGFDGYKEALEFFCKVSRNIV